MEVKGTLYNQHIETEDREWNMSSHCKSGKYMVIITFPSVTLIMENDIIHLIVVGIFFNHVRSLDHKRR